MKNFNTDDMEKLFTALAEKLQKQTKCSTSKYEIFLTGGSAMMLSIGIRRTTTDIDVVFRKNAKIIHDCAIEVSEEIGVDRGWCNDLVTLSNSYTPAVMTYSTLYKSYGCLDVYVPEAELLLCMKLISFREKDASDIDSLLDYIEADSGEISMNDLNSWFVTYYEAFGKAPKFKRNAIQFIKETFV